MSSINLGRSALPTIRPDARHGPAQYLRTNDLVELAQAPELACFIVHSIISTTVMGSRPPRSETSSMESGRF